VFEPGCASFLGESPHLLRFLNYVANIILESKRDDGEMEEEKGEKE
jgi:hypothetical protein